MKSPNVILRVLWGVFVCTFAGCSGGQTPPPAKSLEAHATAEPAGGAAEPVTLRIASWEQTQQMVADNRGKVVVLDLWATW